jgi:hypothetical protein
MAKRKRTNNDLQNTTHKTKDRATRTPLKPGRSYHLCCNRLCDIGVSMGESKEMQGASIIRLNAGIYFL